MLRGFKALDLRGHHLGFERDALPDRSVLDLRIQALVESGRVRTITNVHIQALHETVEGIVIVGDELSHPEEDFYNVGMKSYGRAPSFLTLTGYEQVRSIVTTLTGDYEAARNVELVLPETGVCSTDASGSCGLPST